MNQGTQGYSLMKKTEGRKSRDTVSLNDLTNRKEASPSSPAGPHIRSGLLDPTSFQKLRFRADSTEFILNEIK
jgi:hypothetical protein